MKILTIGQKDYVVKYTINSLVAMENMLGRPFTEIFSEGMSLTTIRTLIYCGLKDNAHDLTVEGAGEILNDAIESGFSFQEIANVFVSEVTKALGVKAAADPIPNV